MWFCCTWTTVRCSPSSAPTASCCCCCATHQCCRCLFVCVCVWVCLSVCLVYLHAIFYGRTLGTLSICTLSAFASISLSPPHLLFPHSFFSVCLFAFGLVLRLQNCNWWLSALAINCSTSSMALLQAPVNGQVNKYEYNKCSSRTQGCINWRVQSGLGVSFFWDGTLIYANYRCVISSAKDVPDPRLSFLSKTRSVQHWDE